MIVERYGETLLSCTGCGAHGWHIVEETRRRRGWVQLLRGLDAGVAQFAVCAACGARRQSCPR